MLDSLIPLWDNKSEELIVRFVIIKTKTEIVQRTWFNLWRLKNSRRKYNRSKLIFINSVNSNSKCQNKCVKNEIWSKVKVKNEIRITHECRIKNEVRSRVSHKLQIERCLEPTWCTIRRMSWESEDQGEHSQILLHNFLWYLC